MCSLPVYCTWNLALLHLMYRSQKYFYKTWNTKLFYVRQKNIFALYTISIVIMNISFCWPAVTAESPGPMYLTVYVLKVLEEKGSFTVLKYKWLPCKPWCPKLIIYSTYFVFWAIGKIQRGSALLQQIWFAKHLCFLVKQTKYEEICLKLPFH